jgi:tetratricopeptide (TPR) repeat protein
MRLNLAISAIVLVVLPASAQSITQEDLDRCASQGGLPYKTAIENCTHLIEGGKLSRTNLLEVYSNRGDAYETIGQYDDEIADDTAMLQIDPESANAYNNRAWAYHLKGQDAKALLDAQKAVALDPEYGSALESRAEIYEKLGQQDRLSLHAEASRH